MIEDLTDLLPALHQAKQTHTRYRAAQVQGFEHTFDLAGGPSSVRATMAIAGLVDGLPGHTTATIDPLALQAIALAAPTPR